MVGIQVVVLLGLWWMLWLLLLGIFISFSIFWSRSSGFLCMVIGYVIMFLSMILRLFFRFRWVLVVVSVLFLFRGIFVGRRFLRVGWRLLVSILLRGRIGRWIIFFASMWIWCFGIRGVLRFWEIQWLLFIRVIMLYFVNSFFTSVGMFLLFSWQTVRGIFIMEGRFLGGGQLTCTSLLGVVIWLFWQIRLMVLWQFGRRRVI